MRKKNIFYILLGLVFLIVFNTIFYLFGGTEREKSIWISYIFIHAAYLILLLTPVFAHKTGSASVFRFTIGWISFCYFAVEFIFGTIFILIAPDGYKIVLMLQIILAGIFAAAFFINMMANKHTAGDEKSHQTGINYIRDASVTVKNLMNRLNSSSAPAEIKRAAENIYDAICASQVKSRPQLDQLENQILTKINDLKNAISSENWETALTTSHSITNMVNERNKRLKTLN